MCRSAPLPRRNAAVSRQHPALQIRDAGPDDTQTIAVFNIAMAWETERKRLDPATAERGVRDGLADPNRCRYFVAERHGELVGQAMITFEWSDWRAATFWWLQSVYVHPDHRGHGVFTALFRHIRDAAQQTPGVCGLRLYVERDNHRAKRAYERLGMHPTPHELFEIDWSPLGPGHHPHAQS
jgi:GNAT superfamily N-acetyltransferase